MLVTNKFFQTYFHNQVACLKPFNSYEWPRQNFSLLYLYNIMQTSDENKKISIIGLLIDPILNSPN